MNTSLLALATSVSFLGLTGIFPYRPTNEARHSAETITADSLRGDIRFLSGDLLEGRLPASRGDQITQQYIAAQFEAAGLKPAAPGNSWVQPFDLVGVTSGAPKTIHFKSGGKTLPLTYNEDYIGVSGVQAPSAAVEQAEVVFVGYGITAPEFQWDDYKGIDLAGKILLVMNNDPSADPTLFAGKTRLYYGRWTYKYEMAAQKGAVGAIIIHTPESAGYPWQVVQSSWSGEQFELPSEGEKTVKFKGWVTEEGAKKISALSGKSLDTLRAAAEKRDFQPVPLGVKLSLRMKNHVRKATTANVLGLLPGSDPERSKEAVIYMAHHDHLGTKENAKPGEDAIYNGALDNASGVAGILAIARAYSSLSTKPSRSILFAAVAAEEQGLLGSQYFARHPVIEPGRMAAVINIDGMSIWGKAKDITFIGKGKSSLDGTVTAIARMQGRTVNPDQFPEKGYFYRSDQFNLAKIGVPAAFFETGVDIVGKPEGWGKSQIEKWEETNYHQPSDEFRPEWDLSGAVLDLQLGFYLGYSVGQAREMPKWNRGDEFEAARIEALNRLASK